MTLQDNVFWIIYTHLYIRKLVWWVQPFQSYISCTYTVEEIKIMDKEREERFINQSYPQPTIFLPAHASSGGWKWQK